MAETRGHPAGPAARTAPASVPAAATTTPPAEGEPLVGFEDVDTAAVRVEARSAGYQCGNFAAFRVNGRDVPLGPETPRGIFVMAVDPVTAEVLMPPTGFDTYERAEDSTKLREAVDTVPWGAIVAMAVHDDATNSLNDDALHSLEQCGSALVDPPPGSRRAGRVLRYRESWAMVGRRGAVPGSVPEQLTSANAPTRWVCNADPVDSGEAALAMRKAAAASRMWVMSRRPRAQVELTVVGRGYRCKNRSTVLFSLNGRPVQAAPNDNGHWRGYQVLVLPLELERLGAMLAVCEDGQTQAEAIRARHGGGDGAASAGAGSGGGAAARGPGSGPDTQSGRGGAAKGAGAAAPSARAAAARHAALDSDPRRDAEGDAEAGAGARLIVRAFDTYSDLAASQAMHDTICSQPAGTLVAVASFDEATARAVRDLVFAALWSIGSAWCPMLGTRGSFACIGRVGFVSGAGADHARIGDTRTAVSGCATEDVAAYRETRTLRTSVEWERRGALVACRAMVKARRAVVAAVTPAAAVTHSGSATRGGRGPGVPLTAAGVNPGGDGDADGDWPAAVAWLTATHGSSGTHVCPMGVFQRVVSFL